MEITRPLLISAKVLNISSRFGGPVWADLCGLRNQGVGPGSGGPGSGCGTGSGAGPGSGGGGPGFGGGLVDGRRFPRK